MLVELLLCIGKEKFAYIINFSIAKEYCKGGFKVKFSRKLKYIY